MAGGESRYLEALSSVADATALLSAAWRAGHWPALLDPPRVSTVRELRRHAGSRRTLRLTLAGGDAGERPLIAKLYAHADAPAAATLITLARFGLAAPSGFRVPAVTVVVPEAHLLLCELAPGVPVKACVRGGASPGGALAAEAAAHWLAAFDAAPLMAPSSYALHDPLAQAARWCSRLAHTVPSLAAAVRSVYAALMSARPPWPPPTARMIHGDFVIEHVFVAPDAVTVIDWDSCRPGDPAEDAGRFVASLHGLRARGRADAATVSAAVERFVATYAAEQPGNAPRVPFYAALACLHKASRARRDDTPQRVRAASLLAAAEALLVP
ncbi:MAG: phosphotransferase family protein [Ktedonobacterales bacterium]